MTLYWLQVIQNVGANSEYLRFVNTTKTCVHRENDGHGLIMLSLSICGHSTVNRQNQKAYASDEILGDGNNAVAARISTLLVIVIVIVVVIVVVVIERCGVTFIAGSFAYFRLSRMVAVQFE